MSLLDERNRWLRVSLFSAGMGLIFGSLEGLEIMINLRLDLSLVQRWMLSATASLAGLGLGLAAGLASGLLLQLSAKSWPRHKVDAAGLALSTLMLSGFYLGHLALQIQQQGRSAAALLMLSCCLPLAVVVWLNAKFWSRREELGLDTRIGWRLVSVLSSVLLVGVSGFLSPSKIGKGGMQALEGDPNVLLITIDTLRRDHVSAYGEGRAKTPRMDALAEEGALFWNALTPTPETAPAHASMLSALHPLRHEVLSNGHRMNESVDTVAERLSDEGYHTGAFLSSFAVNSRTGLSQGFGIFDDDFTPYLRGVNSVLVTRYLLNAIMIFGSPHHVPFLLERGGKETNRLAQEWIRSQGRKPWFAWVHYFEPHAPYEGPDQTVDHRKLLDDPHPTYTEEQAKELRRLYAYEAGLSDDLVGELLDLLEELELADNTLVIVTADHGEQLGEHDIWFHHHHLYDESLQVPLILRAPGRTMEQPRVDAQVRLMDVAPTIMDWVGLERMNPSEGVSLLEFAEGKRQASLSTTLYGRRSASLSEGTLFGARVAANFGEDLVDIKYILDPATGEEELYNLFTDRAEAENIAGTQPESLEALRDVVRQEVGAASGLAAQVDDASVEKLRALGYIE